MMVRNIADVRNCRCVAAFCMLTVPFYGILLGSVPVAAGIAICYFKYQQQQQQPKSRNEGYVNSGGGGGGGDQFLYSHLSTMTPLPTFDTSS